MSATTAKKIIIIAGPNGAGKTTFAREFLPTDEACLNFVNADLIAAGLSPFAPEAVAIQAGRLILLPTCRVTVPWWMCGMCMTTAAPSP